jgi:hypothetical protein
MAGRSNPPLFDLIRQEKPRVRSAPPQPAGGNPRMDSGGTAVAEPPTIAEPKPPRQEPLPDARPDARSDASPDAEQEARPETRSEPERESGHESQSAPREPDAPERSSASAPADVNARAVERAPSVPLRERVAALRGKLAALPKLLPQIPDFQIPSRISDLKQSVTMPVSRLWIGGILAAAALIAVVWISVTWAFQAGKTSQDLSPYLADSGPILTDPLAEPGAGESLSRTPPKAELLPKSTPQTPVPKPQIPEDTREIGLNYLQLTSFVERKEAFAAAAFLTEAGVPTIPVGMDTGRVDGNNREKYLLIALEGIPGDRFKALADRRAQIRRRVQELGRIWTKEHGGTHSFHDPQWAKHR